MTRDQLLEKSLGDLREIAKLQGVKSITKYRKGELVDIIMNGGSIQVLGSMTVDGGLHVSGNVSISGTLSVTGGIILNGNRIE